MPTFPKGHSSHSTSKRNSGFLERLSRPPTPLSPTRDLSDAIIRDRTIMQLLSRDGNHCYLCGRQNDPLDYELDHIIASSIGGPTRLSNLALTCKPCNIRKSNHIISFTIADRTPCYALAPLSRGW